MSSITPEQIEVLAEKMMLGTITPEERQVLLEWANRGSGDQLYWASGDADENALKDRLLARIRVSAGMEGAMEISQGEVVAASVRRLPFRRIVAAAAALLLLVGGGYFYLHRRTSEKQMNIAAATSKPIGAPGGNRATLTLSGGRQLLLDSAMRDTTLMEGNAEVANISGRLAYNAGVHQSNEMVYNTLSTARGGQYQLTLPDGTKAWLNAASSVTYPTVFTGASRQVTITGEVYFEVKDNPQQPFLVTAGAATITVLGTHFDVQSYDDEPVLRTTLLEGSVKMNNGGEAVLLHPGEQARMDVRTHRTQVKTVDTDDAVAWVKEKLSLESDDIGTLMRQLSRWYDVDVRYEGTPPRTRLFGTINRNINLSEVLTALGGYGVRARLSGRTIIVSAK